MIQTIINYLNLRVETLGRIAHLYGITEKRKRSGDDAAIPYAYVGAGQFEPVDIDNGNAGWWRPRSGFTMEPVEVIGRAVKQQRASYPLRFVAVLRRDLSVADDAFMPSRLAEDISNALNFDNGDLRNILKALNVEARTSSVEFDASAIWATEFHTSIPDLHYELAMVAVDVTVEVVAKYSCWEGECATDLDILRLFNFCDPSVIARLTDEQVACLIAQYNEPCEDATITINSAPFGTAPSGGALNVPVIQNGSPVGAKVGSNWVIPPCADGDVTVNAVAFGNAPSGGSLNVPVKNSAGTLRGSKVGSDWVVPDGSVPVTNTAATPITTIAVPSGNPVPYVIPNVAWTNSNGSPQSTPYGDLIACTMAGPSGSVAVTVSNATPSTGQTITITATASGFTPTNFLFFAKQGDDLYKIPWANTTDNVITWTVNLIGAFSIFVQADDAVTGVFNVGGSQLTSTGAIITTGMQLWLDPHFSGITGTTYPDISGLGRDGNLINSPTVDTNLNGGNVSFNGVNQRVGSIGSLSDLSFIQNTVVFTVEVWVKVNNAGVVNFIAGNAAASAQHGFYIVHNEVDQRLEMYLLRGVAGTFRYIRSGGLTITTTGWHHVCVTMNGLGTAKWYVNAVVQPTLESGTYVLPSGDSTNELEIGKIGGFSGFLSGAVGPFRVYNVPLTDVQVSNNFKTERSRYGI
jgi:hypothetical protein